MGHIVAILGVDHTILSIRDKNSAGEKADAFDLDPVMVTKTVVTEV
mgnify:CR=1 FL=1